MARGSPTRPEREKEQKGERLDISGIRTFRREIALWSVENRCFYDYWSSLQSDGPSTRFEDFDLLKVAPLLPGAYLLEIIQEPLDFRLLFLGSDITNFLGRDSTGKLLSTLSDTSFNARSQFIVQKVAREGEPVVNQIMNGVQRGQEYLALESLTMPLVDEEGRVSHVIGRTTILHNTDS